MVSIVRRGLKENTYIGGVYVYYCGYFGNFCYYLWDDEGWVCLVFFCLEIFFRGI